MKTSKILVTSYEHKILCGTLCNPFFGADQPFRGLVCLLLLLESLLDGLEYPQRSTETRLFRDTELRPPPLAEAPDENASPPLATFLVSVYFRQNTSWQGTIVWAERNQSANFRSVLELISLLDGALSAVC